LAGNEHTEQQQQQQQIREYAAAAVQPASLALSLHGRMPQQWCGAALQQRVSGSINSLAEAAASDADHGHSNTAGKPRSYDASAAVLYMAVLVVSFAHSKSSAYAAAVDALMFC
jgi:hypothetical protein